MRDILFNAQFCLSDGIIWRNNGKSISLEVVSIFVRDLFRDLYFCPPAEALRAMATTPSFFVHGADTTERFFPEKSLTRC